MKFFVKDVVDIVYCLKDAFAQIDGLVAVAEFAGLVDAGGGSGGDGRAAHHAGFGKDIGLDGRGAAGIHDFTCDDFNDCAHLL